MTRLWIVRAGAHGERELAAIDQSKLLPGFLKVGDLTQHCSRDAILSHLQEVLPDEGGNRLRNFAAQLNQFVNRIEIGDYVVMPLKLTNGVAIGVVKGGYQFDASSDFKHAPRRGLAGRIAAPRHLQTRPSAQLRRVHDHLRDQAQFGA